MLTLIATCLLTAGTMFTPLPEWTITEIIGGGKPRGSYIFGGSHILLPSINCINKMGESIPCAEPDYSTRITMQRSLAPGQVAESPQGCTLKMEVKE